MITLEDCVEFAALRPNELFTGSVLSTRHESLLSSYRLNLTRGPGTVRRMIVSDIRAAIDLDASKYAADLVLVLRLFLTKHPEARIPRLLRWTPDAPTRRRPDDDHQANVRNLSEARCRGSM